MKIEIKEFIHSHLNEFEDLELESGHEFRFEKKFKKSKRKHRIHATFQYFAIAASLALMIVAGKTWFSTQNKIAPAIDPEIVEISHYFGNKIQKKIEILDTLKCRINLDKNLVFEDLKEMDKEISELNNELKKNPLNEQIKQAWVLSLKNKDELLNKIILRIKEKC